MVAGFQGPLTDAVLADWKQRQFGGLLVVNLNHNADSPAAMTAPSSRALRRGSDAHRLIAATDQEGGQVCIAMSTVPCEPMPVGQAATTRMATAVKALGFDLDLGPVADVCNGPASIMWGRCYGTDPLPSPGGGRRRRHTRGAHAVGRVHFLATATGCRPRDAWLP